MRRIRRPTIRAGLVMTLVVVLATISIRQKADTGSCGGTTIVLPFTDVMGNPFFCEIAEAYFTGLTNGTSPTTYSPSQNVPREQMAALITRTLDQSLKRDSKRAALNQWWTTKPAYEMDLGTTVLDSSPSLLQSDGLDIWVADGSVVRVRASDGRILETWTAAQHAFAVQIAMGRVFAAAFPDQLTSGTLYMINPTQPPGAVTTVTSDLGQVPTGIAFDGARLWIANSGGCCSSGSVSIVTPQSSLPWAVTTIPMTGNPFGILFDGINIWVTSGGNYTLKKLDANGMVVQTIPMPGLPNYPVFDGTNIWVPIYGAEKIVVVRASTGAIVATLTGNGLSGPWAAAFDGERILVTNNTGSTVSLWKAADLTPLGFFSTGVGSMPFGVCSDGVNFWIALNGQARIARF